VTASVLGQRGVADDDVQPGAGRRAGDVGTQQGDNRRGLDDVLGVLEAGGVPACEAHQRGSVALDFVEGGSGADRWPAGGVFRVDADHDSHASALLHELLPVNEMGAAPAPRPQARPGQRRAW